MDGSRWLRADGRFVVPAVLVMVGLFWWVVAGLQLLWWMGSGRPLFAPPATLAGCAVAFTTWTLLVGKLAALNWPVFMQGCAWRVDSDGVAAYRGDRRRQFLAWDAIDRVEILPRGALLVGGRSQVGLQLAWLTHEDACWFRAVATARLGERAYPGALVEFWDRATARWGNRP